jgi:hypothetical protein
MIQPISPQADTIYVDAAAGAQLPVKTAATKEAINRVLEDFSAAHLADSHPCRVVDCFFYIFNSDDFAHWHQMDWWRQRKILRNLKSNIGYTDRAEEMLSRSAFREQYAIPDSKVGYYSDPRVSYGWMRKRLLLKESYWNILDSIAYGAYHKNKYKDIFPGIGILLLAEPEASDDPNEILLIIDNGAGRDFKKTSKDSGAFRLLYKLWKLVHRRGLYLIGGLHLGLQETCGILHCYGTGAVTTQCSFAEYAASRSGQSL